MKKYFHILLLTGALIFSVQVSVAPLLHNHPVDLIHHYDCPGYILSINLVSFSVAFLLSISLAIPFLRKIIERKAFQNKLSPQLFIVLNKAPPQQII